MNEVSQFISNFSGSKDSAKEINDFFASKFELIVNHVLFQLMTFL